MSMISSPQQASVRHRADVANVPIPNARGETEHFNSDNIDNDGVSYINAGELQDSAIRSSSRANLAVPEDATDRDPLQPAKRINET